jgi:prepilin-type N-terminal cleavage/methylation domain-containing protein
MLRSRRACRRCRRSRSEQGFTLLESVVTVTIMLVVLSVFLGIFDSLNKTQINVMARADNQNDVQVAFDQMVRDVSAANPLDSFVSTTSYPSEAQVEIGPNPGTRTVIRWYYDTTSTSSTYEDLLRQTMSGSSSTATVSSQAVVLTKVRNVESSIPLFTYYDAKGNQLTATGSATLANITNCTVRIHVQVVANPETGPQPFTENTDIELRNRLPGGIEGC